MKNQKKSLSSAFTIVELLIVIVIIGILAAITIVSYTGIAKKANEATIQADLVNASKKIKMYYALYGSYPESMPNDGSGKYCPSGPKVDNNYCVKPSTGTFVYSAPSPTLDFILTANNGTSVYSVTRDHTPYSVVATPVTAIAAISGTAQASQILTAGALTPAAATVSYQWQSATTAGGVYSNIAGATSNTYAVSPAMIGRYIKVVVTGTGVYSGTQASAATVQVPADANWLTIGGQTWAKANLNVGIMVTGAAEQTNNAVTEKYCYQNDESYCTTYGAFYQWNEAMRYLASESSQGLCPVGAHIPSDNDWKILEMQLGMSQSQADMLAWRGTDQGLRLKPGGSSNLNLSLAGYRTTDGIFFTRQSLYSYLWSSSESGNGAWYRYLEVNDTTIGRGVYEKNYGFSVRCLGD